jgi:hypothetical protein
VDVDQAPATALEVKDHVNVRRLVLGCDRRVNVLGEPAAVAEVEVEMPMEARGRGSRGPAKLIAEATATASGPLHEGSGSPSSAASW